jgi:hypothetical protein
MTEAPLHPRRIQAALEWLEDETAFECGQNGGTDQRETCLAALTLLQKTQRATGLTPEIADVGAHMLGMVDYVKKGFLRK